MSKHEKIIFSLRDAIKQSISKNLSLVHLDQQTEIRLRNILAASIDEAYHSQIDDILSQLDENSQMISSTPDSFFDVLYELSKRLKRGAAAFTIVRNESVFLDLWVSYYASALGFENIFVLDNSSSDGSIERLKERNPSVNIVHVPLQRSCNYQWQTDIIKTFQRVLLRAYDVCIYADSDEILIPNSGSLSEFCTQVKTYVRATGFGVVHQVDSESKADPKDILAKRSLMWRAPQYDKTLISRLPLDWTKGQHEIYIDNAKDITKPSETLSLLHLRDVDFDLFCSRLESRLRENPINKPYGPQNSDQVRSWLKTDFTSEYSGDPLEIPEYWKRLLKQP